MIGMSRPPRPTTLAGFWELARYSFDLAEHYADTALRSLATAELETLKYVLVQYRWFTGSYPGDLGVLVSKLPPSRLRSLIGELITEETGNGEPSQAHLVLYDSFLISMGVTADWVSKSTNPMCIALLDAMRYQLMQGSYAFGIGLRGMGGECLCHAYLKAMNHYLLKNPIVQELRSSGTIDWRFWDLHAGEHDEAHSLATRAHIAEVIGPGEMGDLCEGYLHAESKWKIFWSLAFDPSLAPKLGLVPKLPPESEKFVGGDP